MGKWKRNVFKHALLMRALEPRLMFDAAIVGVSDPHSTPVDVHPSEPPSTQISDASNTHSSPATTGGSTSFEPAQPAPTATPNQTAPENSVGSAAWDAIKISTADASVDAGKTEILFISSTQPNWQSIAESTRPGVEVVVFNGAGNGLAEISNYLQVRQSYDAIHIVGDCGATTLQLGTEQIALDSVSSSIAGMSSITGALKSGGEIAVYGATASTLISRETLTEIVDLSASTGADGVTRINETLDHPVRVDGDHLGVFTGDPSSANASYALMTVTAAAGQPLETLPANVAEQVMRAQVEADRLLGTLLNRPDSVQKLYGYFQGDSAQPDQAWLQSANAFLRAYEAGQINLHVELRSSAELLGAFGAFAQQGPDGTPVMLNCTPFRQDTGASRRTQG